MLFRASASLVALAVAWVAAHPAVTAPTMGASRPEQLADGVSSTELRLDADLKARLDEVTAEYQMGDAVR